MTLKPIGHNCPVCTKEVFGYRYTRRYCSDSCKARHHIDAKKQLKERLELEISLRQMQEEELGPQSTKYFNERYSNLIMRDFYLCEGILGPNFTEATVNLKSLKSFKFQVGEAFQVEDDGEQKIYKICNYEYFVEGELLKIKRLSYSPPFCQGYYERWLLEYPLPEFYRENLGEGDLELRDRILESGGVWRE